MPVTKRIEDFNVDIANNGFVINYSGYDDEGEYQYVKLVFRDLNQLQDHIAYIVSLGES